LCSASHGAASCALWPVDIRITHVDCKPAETLIHFQGQYLTTFELDYNILHVEIQNAEKKEVSVKVGELCLVEDALSGHWFRGRVQNQQNELFDVFLIDYGNVLTVKSKHLACATDELLMLPPKVICGFFANVLPVSECWDHLAEKYFLSLIGSTVSGFICAFLPHKVLLLEAPGITGDLIRRDLGKYVNTDMFLMLVEMLVEVPVNRNCGPVPDMLIDAHISPKFLLKPAVENIYSVYGPKLTVGKKERVRITGGVSQKAFYCQMTCMEGDLEDMAKKLTKICESRSQRNRDAGNLGLMCSVKGKDDKWHRGFIHNIFLNAQVRVMFVDYGFCELVEGTNIAEIPSDFLMKPIMAFPCAMSCLNQKEEVVNTQQMNLLKKGLLGEIVQVHIDDFDSQSKVYFVTLHNAESYADQISEKLAGKSSDELEIDSSLPATLSLQQMPLVPDYSVQMEEFQEGRLQSSGQIGGPEKTTVPEQKQNVISHAKSKSENTTKQAHNQMEIFRIHKYAPGSELEVCCSQINSPSDFWCQNLSKISTLDKLMHEMQVYYKNNSEPLQPCAHVCAAKLKDDGRWYRGYILAVNLDMYKVVFVDYGLTINETMHNLQTLPKQFIEIEAQGFRCSLYNLIEPKDAKVWDSSAARALRQFVSEGSATVTCIIHSWLYVTNMGLYNVVDLCKTSQKASTHLVEKGLAVRMATPKQLVSSTCPLSFFYSSFDLEIGSIEKVYVTHVGSPWEIYLQLDRNGEQFENLLNKIAEESAKTSDPASVAHPGNMWLAKYVSDGKWYRAIRKPVVNDQIFEAFFIDYGNRQVVEKGSLRIIPRSATALLLTPMQAVKCSLLNVTRGDLLAEVNKWLDNAICNKAIQATIVAKGKDGSFVCDLFDEDTHINEKVRELIRHGKEERAIVPVKDCNENVKPDKCSLAIPSNKKYHSQEKAKEDTRLNLTVKAQTRKSTHARPLLQAENQKASPPHSTQNRDGTTSKCTKSVVKPEMSTVELTKFSRLPGLKLNPGFRGTGFVSHMNSVNNFYIQLEEHEWKILKMVEELNSSLFRQNTEPASGATIGDLIAAEFDEDNALYRAVVIDDCMATHFKVAFVDYGNVTSVEKKNTLKLTGLFLTQPRLSIPCCLATNHGFADNTSFETAVDKKPLTVEFIRNLQAQWEVKIELQEDSFVWLQYHPWQPAVPKRARVTDKQLHGVLCIRLDDETTHRGDLENAVDDHLAKCAPLSEAELMIGLECLVKLSSSEQWCRAAIHQVFTAEQKCMVYLLDHGTTETADVKFLRKLCPDLRLVPPRTVCCKLNGFDETWKEADIGTLADRDSNLLITGPLP
uniref:Tudor domain-containing protein n=1 Tax=Denticeps clupeoides TaxID=299321 RepID=A0AAY4CA05_9TELE